VQDVLGAVHIHLDLFEDDLLFLLDVRRGKERAEDQVGDDVEGDGQVLVEDLGVEAGELFGGEGVEHAADGVHGAGDLLGGAALGALEDHVLEEMGEAVVGGGLGTRAGAHPDADRDGAHVGHGLGDDDEAVGQDLALDVAYLRIHCLSLTQAGGKGEGRERWPATVIRDW